MRTARRGSPSGPRRPSCETARRSGPGRVRPGRAWWICLSALAGPAEVAVKPYELRDALVTPGMLDEGAGGAWMNRACKITPDGKTILRLRLEKGLGRDEVARKAGISVKTLRNLETKPGHHATPLVISCLATYFGIDRSALVERSLPATSVLTSTADILRANVDIAGSARDVLLCVGSRSRDASYLRAIEAALEANPRLSHYRVMALPPFKPIFQQHLLRLIEIRDPLDRSCGYKTIHVGIYRDTIRQPECGVCVNETTALVVLPSISSVGEYNTAMLTNDKRVVDGLINLGKTLYQMSAPLETPGAIVAVGLLGNGDYYE
jgi:transcriptional regulator with XRE-family HTH domain